MASTNGYNLKQMQDLDPQQNLQQQQQFTIPGKNQTDMLNPLQQQEITTQQQQGMYYLSSAPNQNSNYENLYAPFAQECYPPSQITQNQGYLDFFDNTLTNDDNQPLYHQNTLPDFCMLDGLDFKYSVAESFASTAVENELLMTLNGEMDKSQMQSVDDSSENSLLFGQKNNDGIFLNELNVFYGNRGKYL